MADIMGREQSAFELLATHPLTCWSPFCTGQLCLMTRERAGLTTIWLRHPKDIHTDTSGVRCSDLLLQCDGPVPEFLFGPDNLQSLESSWRSAPWAPPLHSEAQTGTGKGTPRAALECTHGDICQTAMR